MTESPKLGLAYLVASQAQKEITHNDALNDLDCLVQLSVMDKDLTAEPPSPVEGVSYIVGAGATDAWQGQDYKIASYYAGWRFKQPQAGWLAFVQDEMKFYVYNGSSWAVLAGYSS